MCFSLVDSGAKGYIDAQDIKLLARQCGDTLSTEEAEAIVKFSIDRGRIKESHFQHLFSPPSP